MKTARKNILIVTAFLTAVFSVSIAEVSFPGRDRFRTVKFDTDNTTLPEEGQIAYVDEQGGLGIGTPGGGFLTLGAEMQTRVYNDTGAALPNGTLVTFDGGQQGNFPTVMKADADTIDLNAVVGMVTTEAGISDNSFGQITTVGLVRDVAGMSGYSAGEVLYVSSTAGEFTSIRPAYPANAYQIGEVASVTGSTGDINLFLDAWKTWAELDERYAVDNYAVAGLSFNSSSTMAYDVTTAWTPFMFSQVSFLNGDISATTNSITVTNSSVYMMGGTVSFSGTANLALEFRCLTNGVPVNYPYIHRTLSAAGALGNAGTQVFPISLEAGTVITFEVKGSASGSLVIHDGAFTCFKLSPSVDALSVTKGEQMLAATSNAFVAADAELASAVAEKTTTPAPFSATELFYNLDQNLNGGLPLTVLIIGDSLSNGRAPNKFASLLMNRYGMYGLGGMSLGKTATGNAEVVSANTGGGATSDNYEDSPVGNTDQCWNGGILEYGYPEGTAGYLTARKLEIHYLEDPRGGQFEVGYEEMDGTYTVLDTVDSSAVAGKVERTVTYDLPFGSHIGRITALDSSTNHIVSVGMYDDNASGVYSYQLARGGLVMTNMLTYAESNFTNLVGGIDPDVIMYRANDDLGTYGGDPTAFFDYFRTNAPNATWICFNFHEKTADDTTFKPMSDWLKDYCENYGWFFFDENEALGGYDGLVKAGYDDGADTTHLNNAGDQCLLNKLHSQLGLSAVNQSQISFNGRTGGGTTFSYDAYPQTDRDIRLRVVSRRASDVIVDLGSQDNSAYFRLTRFSADDATYPKAWQILGGAGSIELTSHNSRFVFGSQASLMQNPPARVSAYETYNIKNLYHGWHINPSADLLNLQTGAGQVDTFGVTDDGAIRLNDGTDNATCGTVTLASGTATATTSAANSTSMIFIAPKSSSANAGYLSYSVTSGTSLTITSSNASDDRQVHWMIVEPY